MQVKTNYLSDFVIEKQAQGKYTFSLPELKSAFSVSSLTLQQALQRQIKKNKICSIRRNFYIIIPPEYLGQRVLPPSLFIDDLMQFLSRPYYIGLLNAASFYGASHQQPQEFFVMTVKPSLRTISVRGVIVHFVIRKKIHHNLIQKRETQTGYINVSGPGLTALDCIISAERIGGIGRVWEIIQDIIPSLTKKELRMIAQSDTPLPVIQRFGTLLDQNRESQECGDVLYNAIPKKNYRKIMLSLSAGVTKDTPVNRWKVVENVDMESEI